MEVFSVKEWKFFDSNLIIIFGITLVLCCRYRNKQFDSSMESHKITDSSSHLKTFINLNPTGYMKENHKMFSKLNCDTKNDTK